MVSPFHSVLSASAYGYQRPAHQRSRIGAYAATAQLGDHTSRRCTNYVWASKSAYLSTERCVILFIATIDLLYYRKHRLGMKQGLPILQLPEAHSK